MQKFCLCLSCPANKVPLIFNVSAKACFLVSFDILCIYMLRRGQWHPTPVLLPGKFHGGRSLVACSPWGREESDMTEWLDFHFSPSCTGEGNDNPLQCSCLENPRDGGAWWSAVYGVTQSRTRLKWLSSSISSISMADSCWGLTETTKFCKAVILQLKINKLKKLNISKSS